MANNQKMRTESDLLGSVELPADVLYGVQTLRGIENFRISKFHLNEYPLFIKGLAVTKLGAAEANHKLGLLTDEKFNAIAQAPRRIPRGYDPGRCRYDDQHERQRSDRQPRVGDHGPSVRRIPVLLAQRRRELCAIDQRRLPDGYSPGYVRYASEAGRAPEATDRILRKEGCGVRRCPQDGPHAARRRRADDFGPDFPRFRQHPAR